MECRADVRGDRALPRRSTCAVARRQLAVGGRDRVADAGRGGAVHHGAARLGIVVKSSPMRFCRRVMRRSSRRVVGPDYLLGLLSDSERTALRAFEAKFGVREVDGFNYPNASVGLNAPAVVGDINGTTATVTAAGKAGGFGYLNGPVPFSAGSYSYIAEPLAPSAQPPGRVSRPWLVHRCRGVGLVRCWVCIRMLVSSNW